MRSLVPLLAMLSICQVALPKDITILAKNLSAKSEKVVPVESRFVGLVV